jgi:hypothetical protein
MDECDADEANATAPKQQLQQPQPARSAKDEGLSARAGSLPAGLLAGGGRNPPRKNMEEERKGFDEARCTAGIVRFYEAILKEPVPEKMLRLIGELAKRERDS